MPYFSIILPTYNRSKFLPKAIESLLAQSFEDWELIIVDDGSTDNTKKVVEDFKDSRIRYVYQKNQERSVARNNGIKLAKGEYVCFLDSDDYFLPKKLYHFKIAIDQSLDPENIIFYDGLIIEKEGNRRISAIPIAKIGETTHEFLLLNPIGPLQVCGRRKLFKNHQFNPKLSVGEDTELWLRMARKAVFTPVDSHQTVVSEHEDRSINLMKYNFAKKQMKQLDLIFTLYNKDEISKNIRRKIRSDCYFNSAKYFMFNRKRFKAFIWTTRSLIHHWQNNQFKHRIFVFLHLILGRIPKEYIVL